MSIEHINWTNSQSDKMGKEFCFICSNNICTQYLFRSLSWSDVASSIEGISPLILGTCCEAWKKFWQVISKTNNRGNDVLASMYARTQAQYFHQASCTRKLQFIKIFNRKYQMMQNHKIVWCKWAPIDANM